MLGILVIISAMPGPAMAVALSMQYGGNTAFSTRYVFISTLLSVFTIPLLAALLF
jgi:predicted Na+-dependent transporter